jgi:hypothetical protein
MAMYMGLVNFLRDATPHYNWTFEWKCDVQRGHPCPFTLMFHNGVMRVDHRVKSMQTQTLSEAIELLQWIQQKFEILSHAKPN